MQRRVSVLERPVGVDASGEQELDHAETAVLDRLGERAAEVAGGEVEVIEIDRHLRERLEVVARGQLEYGRLFRSESVQRVEAFGLLRPESDVRP